MGQDLNGTIRSDHPVTDDPVRSAPLCYVVDDEPEIRRILVCALEGSGCRTVEFSCACDVIAALAEARPEIIFLDVSLAGSDAVEVIRGAAAHHFTGFVQLISGKEPALLEEIRRIGIRHGVHMLSPLSKPFRADAVRHILRTHFSDHLIAATAEQEQVQACKLENIPHWISLDDILDNGWFELWYQPKIDLKRKRIVGAEGLARARHPELGVVPPGAFLPAASVDAMRKLTELVLITALTDWPLFEQSEPPMRLAINIPVSALTTLAIPDIVRAHRPQSPRWPGLILEVTEDQIVRDIPLAHEIATQLKIYGVALAIDDFGAGYSHLARLRELPFAELKIDRNLVANCGEDATSAALCQTSIDLAHRFGAIAVAEGIEKKTEARALFRMGCDLGQGFLFAPPMQKEAFANLIETEAGRRAS
jgi:EAL domain-containing protein (putative c-di-GMP-specific phosphodiesterase class I)/FixJ family two-component response regulator